MKSLHESDFIEWAKSNNLALDPGYPDIAVLGFGGFDVDASRFWVIPHEPERRPYFIKVMLELLGAWQSCYVWRPMGSWPHMDSVEPERINDVIELRILAGLGLPLGSADIVQFNSAEIDLLITLVFSTSVFGWSVGEDIYIVPDHAQQFLKVSHHSVIHATFRDESTIQLWDHAMTENGFPLPTELPDPTFIRPSWMS
jgi:hypothetical protein